MRIIRLLLSFCVTSILCFASIGCTKLASDFDEKSTASEIISGAERAYIKNDFVRSAEIYLKVEEYFPYSDDSRMALVKAIEAYHAGAKFLDLRSISRKFVKLYPEDVKAPFAKYMVGMSYFEQIIDVERDQGATRDSIKEFSELISDYPKSEYSDLARKNIKIAKNQLAGQEMAVGRYYLKRDNPLAALKRFQTVRDQHSDTPFYPESLYRIVESYLVIGIDSQALLAYDSLIKRSPNSKWTLLAKTKLEESRLKEE
ncbi:MAG: hypothetical protein CML37_03900 [Rhodobacteraceae bacterium]|nr:hypothetical protein [Paracoccaceae bacterium]|tara:strand:- start:690 stop:1463 length:774 start_codon:yes stop_codon:yes gene_type:complete